MVPPLDLDEELRFEERRVAAAPRTAHHAAARALGRGILSGRVLLLDYGARMDRTPALRPRASGFPRSASTWCAMPTPRTPRATELAELGLQARPARSRRRGA